MFAVAGAALLSLAQPAALSAAHAASPAPVPADSAPTTPHNVPSGVHTVTLVTGDVVTTRRSGGKAGGTVDVRSATGAPVDAHVMESNGDLYVMPVAAMHYVAQGALDRNLFNVSELVADGYDDAHRAQLPLIVSYTSAATGLHANTALPGAAKVRDLASIQGAALTEDRGRSADFWRAITAAPASGLKAAAKSDEPALGAGIAHIWLDGVVKATLADTTAQIGAPTAWTKGDTGQGVKVAVLDTGIDAAHPDFAGRIATTRSFVPDEDATDRFGHGTHVASIIAGTGAASDGVERGVAPGAELHIGKVLSDQGQGQDSWVLAGMEWAAVDEHAAVINMSLGSGPSDGTDPLSEAVNRLSAQTGALFVIAAGNFGTPYSVSSPGAADAALTVGAVDSTDAPAFFTSQGPRNGDGGLKPEISAPGVDVLAARSQYAPDGEGSYQTLSGTSMATPHVAGAAALLAAAHPGLTGAQLKDLLASSSKRSTENVFAVGSGRVDVSAALSATVFASATAFAGRPADGSGSAVQRPVTYTNTGDAPVTLALTVEAPDAPADMFRISDPQVVVPAHGTASATLTIDASKATGTAPWSGQILATDTAGNAVTHTAVSLGDQTHKLTLKIKDAQGNPTQGTAWLFRSGSEGPEPIDVDETGVAEFFLPDDVYSVEGFAEVQGVTGPNERGMALLGDPQVVVDHDMTVTLDASKIRRVDVTAPQRTEATFQSIEYYRSMGGSRWRDFLLTQTGYDSLWAQPTTHNVTHGDFYFSARWRKEQPALTIATKTHIYSDALRQEEATPLPDGHHRLPLVAAGNGTSADYAGLDVRGKAVVVRRTGTYPPGVPVADPSDIAQASEAVKAGAKLLLVVNDEPWRRVRQYTRDSSSLPIDIVLLSKDEGEKLYGEASAGGAVLSADAQLASPYVYDLRWSWHNQIPDNLIVQGGPKNLARVNVAFDSPDPTLKGGEFRYDWPDFNPDYSIGWPFGSEPVNSQRVDWVSTQPTYSWGQEAYANNLVYEIEPRMRYQAGSTQKQEWFKPIERPYLNDNYKAPTRSGNWLDIDVPAWGSSDHVGIAQNPYMQNTLTLYQGDTQLAQNSSVSKLGAEAPGAGELPYRLVLDGSRDDSVTPYSSTTHTEWDFTSQATAGDEKAVLPLLQIKYGVDTDEAGKTAKKASLTASVAHLDHAADAGTLSAVTLEVSYDDGHTWQKITSGEDGRFALSAPKGARFVSLRAHAHDSVGNAVAQTVIRAFGLR